MAIQEVHVFPQTTLSEGQGLTGTRKWILDHDDEMDTFVRMVCESHWPGYPDAIPVQVQTGSLWDGAIIKRDCPTDPRLTLTMGGLPKYNKQQVVATYALHRMTNCWPEGTPKPWHPDGTTLTMRIRGSGQMLLVSPAGMQAVAPSAFCGTDGVALGKSVGTRIVVPISEYHICCDRLTTDQVSDIHVAAGGHLDMRNGTVNRDNTDFGREFQFLGCRPGTLLFDGYELVESNVCHPDSPRRWRLTVALKHRVILDSIGKIMTDCDGLAIGWNHDYINVAGNSQWAWRFIQVRNPDVECQASNDDTSYGSIGGSIGDECMPRYAYSQFDRLFGVFELGDPSCDQEESEGDEFQECGDFGQ